MQINFFYSIEVTSSTLPLLALGTIDSVASLLATTLYQGNPDTDRNHKLWNTVSTEEIYNISSVVELVTSIL
jgi:hypothetical protein